MTSIPSPRRACDFCKWHKQLTCETNGLYCEDFSGNTAALADAIDKQIRSRRQKRIGTTPVRGKGGVRSPHISKTKSQFYRSGDALALKRHHEQMQELRAIRGLLEKQECGRRVSAETPGTWEERLDEAIRSYPTTPRAKGGTRKPKCKYQSGGACGHVEVDSSYCSHTPDDPCEHFSSTQKGPDKPSTDPARGRGRQ